MPTYVSCGGLGGKGTIPGGPAACGPGWAWRIVRLTVLFAGCQALCNNKIYYFNIPFSTIINHFNVLTQAAPREVAQIVIQRSSRSGAKFPVVQLVFQIPELYRRTCGDAWSTVLNSISASCSVIFLKFEHPMNLLHNRYIKWARKERLLLIMVKWAPKDH